MDIEPPPPAEVIDLFAEPARGANGSAHEGGPAAPDALMQLKQSFDGWVRSLQAEVRGAGQRADGVAEHFDAFERGVASVRSELQGVKDEVHGAKDAVHGVRDQADGLARRAEETERQLQQAVERFEQQSTRTDALTRELADGTLAVSRELESRTAALAGEIGALRQEVAGLAKVNSTLAGRLRRRTWVGVLALLVIVGVAGWLSWAAIMAKVMAFLPAH